MEDFNGKAHWENAWSGKPDDETSWFQSKPGPSLSMIEDVGPGPKAALIDVGGGASTLVDYLLETGYFDVTVLDISGTALEQARQRLGDRSDRVHWIEADITRFPPTRQFALWHDRAAFHFLLSPDDRKRYVGVMEKALLPDGQAIIATFAPGGPEKCSGLEVVQYDGETLSSELGEGFVLLDQQGEIHLTPDGREQKFGYYRFGRAGWHERNGDIQTR